MDLMKQWRFYRSIDLVDVAVLALVVNLTFAISVTLKTELMATLLLWARNVLTSFQEK